jgi:hypothetical protein
LISNGTHSGAGVLCGCDDAGADEGCEDDDAGGVPDGTGASIVADDDGVGDGDGRGVRVGFGDLT